MSKGQIEPTTTIVAGLIAALVLTGGLGFSLAHLTSDWREKYDICRDNLTELQEELENVEEERDSFESRLQSCRQDRGSLGGRLDSLRSTIENNNQTIESLEEELTEKNNTVIELRNQVNRTINVFDMDEYTIKILDKEINLELIVVFSVSIALLGLTGLIGIWSKNWLITFLLVIVSLLPWLFRIL